MLLLWVSPGLGLARGFSGSLICELDPFGFRWTGGVAKGCFGVLLPKGRWRPKEPGNPGFGVFEKRPGTWELGVVGALRVLGFGSLPPFFTFGFPGCCPFLVCSPRGDNPLFRGVKFGGSPGLKAPGGFFWGTFSLFHLLGVFFSPGPSLFLFSRGVLLQTRGGGTLFAALFF